MVLKMESVTMRKGCTVCCASNLSGVQGQRKTRGGQEVVMVLLLLLLVVLLLLLLLLLLVVMGRVRRR
jgi:hypothetical protein